MITDVVNQPVIPDQTIQIVILNKAAEIQKQQVEILIEKNLGRVVDTRA